MSVPGSDCPTGKWQFATFDAANQKAAALHRGGSSAHPYRCALCGCWHVGNRRANNSKSRQRQ
jgi:hypothetical protein